MCPVTNYLPFLINGVQRGTIDWDNVEMDCAICHEPLLVGGSGLRTLATKPKKDHGEKAIILPCGHIFGKKCFVAFVKQHERPEDEYPTIKCPACRAQISYDCSQLLTIPSGDVRKLRHRAPCLGRPLTLPWKAETLHNFSLPDPASMNQPCGECRESILKLNINYWVNLTVKPILPDVYRCIVFCNKKDRSKYPGPVIIVKNPKARMVSREITRVWRKQNCPLDCWWNGLRESWADPDYHPPKFLLYELAGMPTKQQLMPIMIEMPDMSGADADFPPEDSDEDM